MEINKIFNEDCLEGMKKLPDNSVDSCVTDPPWALKFMGKHWDYELPSIEIFKEIIRVLKPGGHILVCCGTRTQHRMAVNIEDSGFEIRDVICHHYGSGFPKSLSVDKAIDNFLGAEREVTGTRERPGDIRSGNIHGASNHTKGLKTVIDITTPATDAAKKWSGYGTALKPATEFWTLARKPISESTVAENVLKHGTGGINIDGCRIETNDNLNGGGYTEVKHNKGLTGDERSAKGAGMYAAGKTVGRPFVQPQGRFPSNLIMDEYMGSVMDKQSGVSESVKLNCIQQARNDLKSKGEEKIRIRQDEGFTDSGGASRFFYCAKSSKRERSRTNDHCTVKPIKLMEYLVKLITPKGAVCLDPFAGSGTTLLAAKNVGVYFIGYEKEEHHFKIIERRFKMFCKQQSLFD